MYVSGGDCNPRDMVFNSLGEIIITSSEKIKVYVDKDSRKLIKYQGPRSIGLQSPMRICLKLAVDSTNNIYIAPVYGTKDSCTVYNFP